MIHVSKAMRRHGILCKIPGLFNGDYNSFKGYVKDLWFGLFDNDGNKRTNVLGSRYTTTLKSMMIAQSAKLLVLLKSGS